MTRAIKTYFVWLDSIDKIDKAIIACIIYVSAITLSGLVLPIFTSFDPIVYAVLAKNIVQSNNWSDLIYRGTDWLDKPHFPFWINAVFFKLFGTSVRTYVFCGMVFHFIGSVYTGLIAKRLFNRRIGLLAVLLYLSTLHLLSSSVDVRAEAYLLGLIIPACYYWLKYDSSSKAKYLLAASLLSACSLMTKGPFVVIVVFSGILATGCWKEWLRKAVSLKWILGYAVTLIFTLPELISLYLQFDLHKDKVVFGKTGVSGVAWFFWGSQFGRFLGTGQIRQHAWDPFFYMHTLLWSLMPWTLVFLLALIWHIRSRKSLDCKVRSSLQYLHMTIWPMFIVFSLAKFHLDHYINIILPFTVIFCAVYITKSVEASSAVMLKVFWYGQKAVILIVLCLGFALWSIMLGYKWLFLLVAILGILVLLQILRGKSDLLNIVLISSVIMTIPFTAMLYMYLNIGEKYDAGYNLALTTNENPSLPVYLDNCSADSIMFYCKNNVFTTLADSPAQKGFIASDSENIQSLKPGLRLINFKKIGCYEEYSRSYIFRKTLGVDKSAVKHVYLFSYALPGN